MTTKRANLLVVLAALIGIGCGEPSASDPLMETVTRALMHGGHDYLFMRSARTWPQAKASCEALGYGLVTVNDAGEEGWLDSFEGSFVWWIGYTDQQSEGSWRWSAGTSSYSNWTPGQPASVSGITDCAEDNYSLGGWADRNCAALLYFICESLL